MSQDTNISQLVINKLTKQQYDSIVTPNESELYLITDDVGITDTDIIAVLGYTPQEELVSGTNIKTINNTSLLGSGNIDIQGGGSITIDQVYDPTSANAQSGVAIAGANFLTASSLNNYVTTNTDQNITGTKTFVGQKKIGFKQSASNNKLGFTLYDNNNVEKGYLEFNPSNNVDGVPLMTLGNYATASAGLTHVGFRKYSNISSASGAYNLLAPLISDAKTPFSLTTTYTNFYLPLGFTDGNSTIKTAKSGLVDLSSIIPTVNNSTITFTQGGVTKGTITLNQASNGTIALDAGSSGGIQNTATGTNSLTILGTPTTFDYAMNIGLYSNVTEDDSIAIGQGARVSGADSLGIGRDCDVSGDNSIQLGYGTLIDDNIFQVWNYPLLDYPNGEIFEDRIPTTIARTSQIPSAVTESTVAGWGFTKNTGTVTSVNNVQPVNGNVTISIPDVSNFVTNSSLATTLGDYVKTSVNNTTQGTTASIGYMNDFAPTMQLTYGNYQMLCGCGEGAILSIIDTTTNTQTAISAIPNGIAIKQGQQQALLSLSDNNLLVNGSELATQTWVTNQGYITSSSLPTMTYTSTTETLTFS